MRNLTTHSHKGSWSRGACAVKLYKFFFYLNGVLYHSCVHTNDRVKIYKYDNLSGTPYTGKET